MLALPDSLLWLFFLVYFAYGQNLDIVSLDSNTSNTTQKRLDEVTKAINLTNIQKHDEEKKENKTLELAAEGDNKKRHSQHISQWDCSINKTSKSDSQILLEHPQELNRTILPDSLGRNGRGRKTNHLSSASNATEIPMMSQERRNSYLSIAERRKYYNRTRVQAKMSQLNDLEMEHQESVSKLATSSTETLQFNEIQEIKKPLTKDSLKEVSTGKTQANNQRVLENFPNNKTQGKPQTIRQSVLQSQYQFGQKLNLRKPFLRAQDTQEERFKKKKEKITEYTIENSTNKLNKIHPTQSTKLIRIDKNLWATTIIPQADAENENLVMYSSENGTVFEKLVDYVIRNHTQRETFSNKEATGLVHHVLGKALSMNQSKVPEANVLNPLPLNNINAIVEGKNVNKNITNENEKILIQDIYNQEILKLNNSIFKATVIKDEPVETSVQNLSNYTNRINNSEAQPTGEATSGASEVPSTNKSINLLNIIVNTTYEANLNSSKIPLHERNGKFSNYDVTQPSVLKSDFTETNREKYQTTTPMVKAIYKEPLNSVTKVRFNQSGTNVLMDSHKFVFQTESKENHKNASLSPRAGKTGSETEEYPLTIELNENNKRVLSEMFQTQTTSKPNLKTKEEIVISQTKLRDILKKEILSESNTSNSSNTTSTAGPETNTQTVSSVTLTTIMTTSSTIIMNTTITTTTEGPHVMPADDNQEDHKAQGTRYSTKFYVSPKFNGTHAIKIVEEDDDIVEDMDIQSPTAGVAVYVLAAFGLVPLLLALVFGTKFMMQRNQREYECESDAKSDISANENQFKDGKKKKGSTDLKKSPSNVTTITLVSPTRLPRVQHWENSEKQGNRNWEFPRSKLKLKTILGQGNFGQVWKAEAEDMPGHDGMTRLVAVKTVKEGATEKEHTEFIKELEIMQQIGSHPNIVTLLGCCTDQEPYYLIMEYVKYGKLLTYLREHRINENYYNFSSDSDALTSRDLTVFAYCVARGMEYLATRGIIHRDLAARNVLVDHNKLCKIADFGMSRSVRDFENGQVYEERQQKGALPIRWMAPESLVYSVFTYKSDVWSFGIVMWEIVTLGSTPYPNMGAREVMRKVRDGYRLERPGHCKPEFYRLISYCWAHDPNKRPDFSELRHELSNLLDNPTKDGSYVDLDRFAVDNSFHVSSKTSDFRILERNDFKTLQKLGDWNKKDWPEDIKKIKLKRGRNNGKGTVTLTGQGSFTVNSRILEKEFKII